MLTKNIVRDNLNKNKEIYFLFMLSLHLNVLISKNLSIHWQLIVAAK